MILSSEKIHLVCFIIFDITQIRHSFSSPAKGRIKEGFMYNLFNKKSNKQKRRDLRKSMTPAEKRLWSYLRKSNLGCKFRRQHGIGPYIVDFFCREKNLVIEVDGETHTTSQEKKYDKTRTNFFHAHNMTVIRFWNNEIYHNIDFVIKDIQYNLSKPPLNLPLGRGRNIRR
jgi:very-short-patch-repair endonuclease